MTKTLLLIGASVRSLLRWARQHVYAWLILTPVVLGITYFTVMRLSENLPAWQPSTPLALALATIFNASLIALSLSRASAEIYHPLRPEAYFDALPVSGAAYLHAALATRVARTAVVAVVALVARATLGAGKLPGALDLPLLFCFIVLTSLSETLGALNWIHWGHKRNPRAAFASLLVLLVNGSIGGLFLTLLLGPSRFSSLSRLWLSVGCFLWMLIVYYVVIRLNARWRGSDLEYARRLQITTRSTFGIERAVESRLPPVVAAQLARDLRLTLRAFSSAVYVAVGVAALCSVALLAALTTEWLPPLLTETAWLDATWLPQIIAIKVACVLAIISLASLLPVLIAYELPHMWIERASGTTGLELLRAKICYARFLTFPAPLVIWCAGILTGSVPAFYALPLLAECLWLWWLVSSLTGALAFEMPTRPDLAIIVNGTLGLALGLVTAMMWLIGLIIYPQVMHSLEARGRQRARYYMITEAE